MDDFAYCIEPDAPPLEPLLINDFETNIFASGNSDQITVSQEIVNQLNGLASMKVDASAISGWQYIYDNTSAFPDGMEYDGFIFRLKSGANVENALFSMFIDGTGFPRAYFMNDVRLLDLSKNQTKTATYHDGWGAIELPEDFDGYVYMPFSGTKGQTAFDPSKIGSVCFGFINDGENWWDGTTSYIDDLYFIDEASLENLYYNTVTEKYIDDDGLSLQADTTKSTIYTALYSKEMPYIEGYSVLGFKVGENGILQTNSTASLANVTADEEIYFVYKKIVKSDLTAVINHLLKITPLSASEEDRLSISGGSTLDIVDLLLIQETLLSE